MKRLAFLCIALLCAHAARGALADASGAPVTAATPFGDVDGETGTVGDLLALAPATSLAPATNYVDAKVAAATNGLLRAEADPAFAAWAGASNVVAGADAAASHESVAIGRGANAVDETAPMYDGAVAVGPDSAARGHAAVAVGKEAKATNAASVALGPFARSHGPDTFSVHADGPEKFFLGDASLRSFLDEDAAAAKAEADAAYYPKADGELWAAWWSGDGFRVTVTNYNVAPAANVAWARLPSARFEYRPDGTNELRTVWDEETKWARWREEFAAATNRVAELLSLKAGLDWGRTTPTGFDAPEGFTWLDTPATVISGGLAWQRTLTSEGAVWVLSSNGMVAQFGADGASTNGYFRISDERGAAAFEVVAGGKVTVGAKADGVSAWTAEDGRTRLRVVYNVESAEPPTLHAAARLLPGGATDWRTPGEDGCAALAQGWTGASGAWTNAVWLAEAPAAGAPSSLFVYATYETGAEPVVRNLAPVQMEKIVLGGRTWTLGTATISGKTVLTLEEAAP